MKRFAMVFLAVLSFTTTAYADKISVGTYHTAEAPDRVFVGVLRVLMEERYSVVTADKVQRTIIVKKTSWGSGTEAGSVYVTLTADQNGTAIQATFTRHSGLIGGGSPTKWADDLGTDLKGVFPDMTTNIVKR